MIEQQATDALVNKVLRRMLAISPHCAVVRKEPRPRKQSIMRDRRNVLLHTLIAQSQHIPKLAKRGWRCERSGQGAIRDTLKH